MSAQTFHPKERLKSRKLINSLFKEGASFSIFPIRCIYLPITPLDEEAPSDYLVQFTSSVPKRAFPKAVDRNRIRRQIKETYRLQKQDFYEQLEGTKTPFALMFIYVAKEPLSYQKIEKATQKILRKLVGRLQE